jgi:hypothetical protein
MDARTARCARPPARLPAGTPADGLGERHERRRLDLVNHRENSGPSNPLLQPRMPTYLPCRWALAGLATYSPTHYEPRFRRIDREDAWVGTTTPDRLGFSDHTDFGGPSGPSVVRHQKYDRAAGHPPRCVDAEKRPESTRCFARVVPPMRSGSGALTAGPRSQAGSTGTDLVRARATANSGLATCGSSSSPP